MSEARYIRLGLVSRVDPDNGMAAVTYPDLDGNTTVDVPVFSFTDEYKMPKVGSTVLVLHSPSGQCAAFILGHIWNKKNKCPHTGEDIWRKELAHDYGTAFMDYDGATNTLTIEAPNIVLRASSSLKIDSPATTNTGSYTGAMDVIGEGISLAHHTHPDPGTGGPA